MQRECARMVRVLTLKPGARSSPWIQRERLGSCEGQKPLASWVPGERLFWHLHKPLIQAGTATLYVGWSCPRGRGEGTPFATHPQLTPAQQPRDGHSDAPRSLAQRLQETRVLGLTSKHPATNRCGKALFYFRLKEFSPLVSCSASSAERETRIF